MRSKILLSVLVIALAAALLAGATGAWFTGTADLAEAEFTAGTVEVSVIGGPTDTPLPGRSISNVNPGDCATICWDIENKGSKSAELRVKINSEFDSNLNEDGVVYYAPKPDSGWDMYKDDEGIMWLYYADGPVAGTYNDVGENFDPEIVELCLVVGFDGPYMGNEYKGAIYTIDGEVEAIQSTNGAMEAEWGTEWNSTLYTDSIDYLNESGMSCWTGIPDPGDEPGECELKVEVLLRHHTGVSYPEAYYFTPVNDSFEVAIDGEGTYEGGATVGVSISSVEINRLEEEGYEWIGWYSESPDTWNQNANVIPGTSVNYTIPSGQDTATLYLVFHEALQ